MKQLVCEMCGSTDLIKQDGVFVCQICGCKYSVEEAKKMMVEGTVEVQGTVSLDKSGEYMNLYQMACDAMRDGNFESAYNYSSKALIINSNEAELIGIQGLSILGKEEIVKDVPTSCVNAISRMFKTFEESQDSFDDKIRKLSNITDYLASACKHKVELYEEETSRLNSQKVDYSSRAETSAAANLALQSLGGNILTQQKAEADLNKEKEKRLHNEELDSQIYKISRKKDAVQRYQREVNNEIDSAKRKIYRQKEKYSYDEYWKTRTEERKSMEKDVASYTSEIELLKKQIAEFDKEKEPILAAISASVPAEATLEEIKESIRTLENKRANLGMLKGRERKRITLEIADLREKINVYEEEVKRQKNDLKEENATKLAAVEEKIEPYRKKS